MSAQQIKLNINDLVNRMEDEDKLQACYVVIATISEDDKKQPKTKAEKPSIEKKNKKKASLEKVIEPSYEAATPHDLSFVFLANEFLKDSESLPEEAILAFDDALMASALKTPTLPNRL